MTGGMANQRAVELARRRLKAVRTVAAHARSGGTDLLLGMILAFVAGAINAGGFLAIGQYISHMTGIVSAIADHLVVGSFAIFGAGLAALLAFTAGAMRGVGTTPTPWSWRQRSSSLSASLAPPATRLPCS
jgi:uncharacterized membrane protein YoaK (UPF0700 family)